MLPLLFEAAVTLFHSINCCLPPDPGTFAKKLLLDVFFSEEKLARSCCTKAVGRELLDQNNLCGIKCELSYRASETIHRVVCVLSSVDRSNQLQVPHTKGAAKRDMEQNCEGEVEYVV